MTPEEAQAKLDEATKEMARLNEALAAAAGDADEKARLEKEVADLKAAIDAGKADLEKAIAEKDAALADETKKREEAEAALAKEHEALEALKATAATKAPEQVLDGDARMGSNGKTPWDDITKEAGEAFDSGDRRKLAKVQEKATRFLAGSIAHELDMEDEVSKEFVEGYDFSYGSIQQILLPDLVKVWGMYNTPLLNRIGSERAVDITDRWEDIQVPAVAENKQVEGIMASALTGVAVYPTVRTNTCQIVSRLIEVTGSADRAARNGVYGRSMADLMAMQMRVQMPQLVAEIEYSALFTVEVTQTSAGNAAAAARAMAGYVGAVGTFTNGLITAAKGATVTTLAGVELTESAFRTWLRAIAVACQSPNDLPTAVLCPLEVMDKMAQWDSVPVRTQDGAAPVRAGIRAVQYEAPWGENIDLVWEPQNSYSATAGNNWLCALCEPNAAMRNLAGTAQGGGLEVINLPKTGDRVQVQLLWEGCNKLEVFAGSGILYNWTCTV